MYSYVFKSALSESGSECLDRRAATLKLFFHSRRTSSKHSPLVSGSVPSWVRRGSSHRKCVSVSSHILRKGTESIMVTFQSKKHILNAFPVNVRHQDSLLSPSVPRRPLRPVSGSTAATPNPNPTGSGPKALSRTLLPIPRRTA